MKIRWIGHAAFYIETADGLKIRTDPYDPSIGLPTSDLPADVVTVSHSHYDHSAVETVPGDPMVIDSPDRRTVQGATIRGVQAFHDELRGAKRGTDIIFVISADGVTLAHAGDLGHPLTKAQLDQLGAVDILCLPVGGVYTLDAKQATAAADAINPKIVIPMHYSLPGLQFKLAAVEPFLEGKKAVRRLDELEVVASAMPADYEVVVLKPRP